MLEIAVAAPKTVSKAATQNSGLECGEGRGAENFPSPLFSALSNTIISKPRFKVRGKYSEKCVFTLRSAAQSHLKADRADIEISAIFLKANASNLVAETKIDDMPSKGPYRPFNYALGGI